MRSIQCCKDNLEGLEEELEGPSQELEEKKREERRRLKKVEDLQKEIQVCVCCVCLFLHAPECRLSPCSNNLASCKKISTRNN